MSSPVVAAVVTVSDRAHRGEREDLSGPALVAAIRASGGEVAHVAIVPDESEPIETELRHLADVGRVPLVLTTGGTGFAPRDVTPEATRRVIEREAPGLAEYARAATIVRTKFAALSRGVGGSAGGRPAGNSLTPSVARCPRPPSGSPRSGCAGHRP